MRRKNMKKTAALFLLSVGINCMTAQDIVPVYEFDIDVQNVGAPIQSTMYGIFFEDINFGADGGLYAELIKNRSFEFENPWGGWEPFGDVSIAEKNPCFDKNSHYAHLTYAGQITGTGLENEGFKGIGIKANENYDFSLYARTETNNPIKLRIELVNRDNDIYETHKKFPDYYQSYGLGFFEYFQLSEDIGAEPLPVLNCGLSCQFENEDMDQHVPVDKLQPYIDDALDLIEFANGPVTSQWGKMRADMGHPASFNLKFIAIGNEQWGPLYPERLEPFVKAIRAKYPEIKIIGSSGPNSEGKDFEYLWPEMKRLKVDLVDEHFYRSPEWFLNSAKRYDSYDRQGPKVFAGEYACHPTNRENSFLTALCEAAFMTGLERNADVVELCTYAPLFAHVDAWQWRPDLIWFDNLNIVKTPNYYVQQLYGHNAGTNVLPLTMNKEAVTGQSELFATAAFDKGTNEFIIKIVNTSIQSKKIKLNLNGISSGKHKGKLTVLHASDLEAKNTLGKPETVIPIESAVELEAPVTEVSIQPLSFLVYRISL